MKNGRFGWIVCVCVRGIENIFLSILWKRWKQLSESEIIYLRLPICRIILQPPKPKPISRARQEVFWVRMCDIQPNRTRPEGWTVVCVCSGGMSNEKKEAKLTQSYLVGQKWMSRATAPKVLWLVKASARSAKPLLARKRTPWCRCMNTNEKLSTPCLGRNDLWTDCRHTASSCPFPDSHRNRQVCDK